MFGVLLEKVEYPLSRKGARLAGKVVLVTGAATGAQQSLMGFGGATARLFAREGASVVLSDINEGMGRSVAEQVCDDGGDAIFTKLDVTSESDWTAAVALTVSIYGKIDVLVNCAGDTVRTRVEETTIEMWNQQMQIHAMSAFLGVKHAVPVMRQCGGGSIVNVGSIAALVGSWTSTAYHGAKGAVRSFTKAAAVQLAKDRIRVNMVHPGFVLTQMTNEVFTGKALRERLSRVPMRRLGTAEEIAHGILYLASDEALFVTGAELVIDGGMTAM